MLAGLLAYQTAWKLPVLPDAALSFKLALIFYNFATTHRDYIEFRMGARLPSNDDKNNNLYKEDASAAGVALRDHYVCKYFS